MVTNSQLRHVYIDLITAGQALSNHRNSLQESVNMIAAEPEKLPQTRHSCLASDYHRSVCFYTGLGTIFKMFVRTSLWRLRLIERSSS